MPEDVVSSRTTLVVGGALLLLTGATIAVAHVNLHGWNSAVGVGIAAAKAVLIALFFMHLRSSPGLTRLVGVAALLWLSILIVGTLDDFLTRSWLPAPGK